MKKDKIILGWVLIALGLLAILLCGLLTGGIDDPSARIFSSLACGLFGGCLVTGGSLLRRGRSEQANRRYEVEQHDERNIANRGKAAYIAFFSLLFLEMALSIYLFYIRNDRVLGFVGYGIAIVSLLVYLILYTVFKKKL